MIKRLLLTLSPALLVLVVGVLAFLPSMVIAGILSTVIIAIVTPLTIAAQHSTRSIGLATGASAAAMALRLIGFGLIMLLLNGRPKALEIEVAIASCLILHVIIECIIGLRSGERSNHE